MPAPKALTVCPTAALCLIPVEVSLKLELLPSGSLSHSKEMIELSVFCQMKSTTQGNFQDIFCVLLPSLNA